MEVLSVQHNYIFYHFYVKDSDSSDLWHSGRIGKNPACQKDLPLLAHICRLPVETVSKLYLTSLDVFLQNIHGKIRMNINTGFRLSTFAASKQ